MLRFAPSPTGDMHIGNLKVAILNYIVSKQRGEKFIIRIEDTDKKRNIEGKDKEILEILNVFGIEYDKVVYQSQNLKFHQQFASYLLSQKKAFSCFCSEEILEKKRQEAKKNKIAYRYDGTCEKLSDEEVLNTQKPFVIRIKKPKEPITFKDKIKGEITFSPEDIDSFVILRVDKTPTYNFACAIDDMLADITFVIRGEDHLSNTPKQILIRKYLGYDKEIEYAHLPIILNKEGKKMSKRENASSVKWLLNEGFLPQAIANYLILLGNKTPKEIFTIKEAIEWFRIENLSKTSAKFDIDKLRFINREHIRMMDSLKLGEMLNRPSKDIGELAKLYTEEASTIKEIREKIDKIFSAKNPPLEFKENFDKIIKAIRNAPYFEEFNDFKNYISKETSLKGKNLFKPLRVALTGEEHGPNLSEIYPHIKNYLLEIAK